MTLEIWLLFLFWCEIQYIWNNSYLNAVVDESEEWSQLIFQFKQVERTTEPNPIEALIFSRFFFPIAYLLEN